MQQATVRKAASRGRRSSPSAPARPEQVATVAALDAIGIAVTVTAIVVLLRVGDAAAGWWVATGVAVVSGVAATIVVARLMVRRWTFAATAESIAQRLDDGGAEGGSPAGSELIAAAQRLRSVALDNDLGPVAARLDEALSVVEAETVEAGR
ncbi:hypothetical protein ACQP2F_24070 [Actinoplanes sp. CA-030573]|uniref:hypothetical protein n=1 Tax=Actinoplanes sp. CA-030573 TaxID=3239898 RepID=UPI003D949636